MPLVPNESDQFLSKILYTKCHKHHALITHKTDTFSDYLSGISRIYLKLDIILDCGMLKFHDAYQWLKETI